MKNIFSVLILFILFMNNISSQELTEDEYQQLSKIFNKVDFATPPDTYQKPKYAGTYSHSKVLEIPNNSGVSKNINKILIIVNSSIYGQVEEKIERYAYDISYVYGCEIVMETVTNSEHTDIKSLILSEQSGLDGVVLIGDLPAAW